MAHVVGDSPFAKRVLLPFWIIRIIVMLIDVAIYALMLVVLAAYKDEINDELREEYGTTLDLKVVLGIVVVVLLILLVCLSLDLVCIIKRARRTLSPRLFLIINVIQTTIWTILFVLSMVGARSGASIAIDVIVYASFVGLLIYASIIFHRARKGTLVGTYAPANNPEAYKMNQTSVHDLGDSAYPMPYHGAAPQQYGNVPHPAYGGQQQGYYS